MGRETNPFNLSSVFAIAIMVRAVYALGVWALGVLVVAGLVTTGPEMTVFFRAGPVWILAPWLLYVLAYGLAGAMIWCGRTDLALLVYAGGFAIDTAIWIAYTSVFLPDVAATRWTVIADLVTNLFDLSVLVWLAMLRVRRSTI